MHSVELFLSSIRSTETRDKYSIYFKKYQEPDLFVEITLVFPSQLIDYIYHAIQLDILFMSNCLIHKRRKY